MQIKNILSANIKKYRTKLGLTQKQAAERAGMTVNYWQRLELASQDDLPSLSMLFKLAKGLSLPVWKLLQF